MIIAQPKEAIAQFVSDRIDTPRHWGDYSTLALVDDKGIVAGVIYNNFTLRDGGYQDCSMHVAAREGSKWAKHDFLTACFSYAFLQMGCYRVTGLVASKNIAAQKLNEHLGFEREAVLKGTTPNDDTIVYRMLAKDCRWLDMASDQVEPTDLIPIHEAWDEKRLKALSESMSDGWKGRPVLALSVNGRTYAMTGTHRITAAFRAGIKVPVRYIDTEKTSDQLLSKYLRACGDYQAAHLLDVELWEMTDG